MDREVRWCLLKLADLVFRGDQEQPPKVVIHLPPTPVIEAPPPVPIVVKPPLKPQRTLSIKDGVTSLKSPLTPTLGSTKLRLPGTGTRVDVSTRVPDVSSPRDARRASNGGFAVPKPPAPNAAAVKVPPKHGSRVKPGTLSVEDRLGLRSIINKLQNYKSAPLFRQPVDPVRDRAPE